MNTQPNDLDRIYLSPPNVGPEEKAALADVLDSGWVAPVGARVDAFEAVLQTYFGADRKVLALNSGTSALHLALMLAGVEKKDHVLVSSFTFAACANTVLYQRATPIFVDSEELSWNIDPDLLEDYLKNAAIKPKAMIVVHLYGMPARMQQIADIAKKYGVILIEDAAEALGTTLDGCPVGGWGDYGIVSFNGNKIITTSAGGALVCRDDASYAKGLHVSTQANLGTHHYEHDQVGYNYRMSNVLAGLGLAQWSKLQDFVDKKRSIFDRYKALLPNQCISFVPEWGSSKSNRWLSTGLLADPSLLLPLIHYLAEKGIETRRLWKPLHLQKAFDKQTFVGQGVCESLYHRGICLPSGTGLQDADQDRVISAFHAFFEKV